MKKLKIIITIILVLNYNNLLNALSINIKAKVEDTIITNLDIENEKKYLFFLNPRLKEIEFSKTNEIAKNSLITEIIKRKELEKNFNFNNKNNVIDIIKRNFITRRNIKNDSDFEKVLKTNQLDYENIKKKWQTEGLWNQLVYQKYVNNIKINKVELRKNILKQVENEKKKFDYNLSEIVFSETDENIEKFLIKVFQSIEDIGFENTANIFSNSNSSKNGGLIGWVNELQISEKINKNLSNVEINGITKPIKIENGFIILKMNDKRLVKEKIDLEDQLNKLVNKETNRQLNNFSIIFLKKLRKNTQINEY